jgi:hypothetical protein
MDRKMTNLRFSSSSEAKKMLNMLYRSSTMNLDDFLDTIELTDFSVKEIHEIYAALKEMSIK